MIQISHRESHDIDIFLDDPQLLGFVDPSRSRLRFDLMPSDYQGDGLRFQKFAFEGIGEIDFGDIIHAAFGTAGKGTKELSQSEALVLMCIAYFQPITRGELSSFFGKEVSRDLIGVLRGQELIASGPRSPQPGAPYTYVTTKNFLSQFGLDTLRQLPDFEALEDAGLLSKEKLLAGGIPAGLANREGEDDIVEDQVP
nr:MULTISPECIES: SMC-Scp complex subunit ScpB [unclassified Mesorhizobium]